MLTVAPMAKLTLTFAILFGLAITAPARAEDKKDDKKAAPAAAEPAQMPWEKACEADVKKLCADVKDDVRPCLADHEKQLSKECTKHFSAAGYRVAKLCGPDIDRLCAAEAAAGKLPQCMNAKAAQLSPKCRDALTPKKPADPEAKNEPAAPKKKGKKSK
jgi:hypothetical protein